jgi:hypothetical protein
MYPANESRVQIVQRRETAATSLILLNCVQPIHEVLGQSQCLAEFYFGNDFFETHSYIEFFIFTRIHCLLLFPFVLSRAD